MSQFVLVLSYLSVSTVQKVTELNFHLPSPNLQKSLSLMEMGRNVCRQDTTEPDAQNTQKIIYLTIQ
jgi:hypothetical protein